MKRIPKPLNRKIHRPMLNFAMSGNMLTDEEIEAIQTGNAELKLGCTTILNLNSDKLHYPTGEYRTLYNGRRFKIAENLLLGLDPED